MARKNNTEDLIHCNVCGEDYSSTYRRCPFCGERADTRASSSSDDDFDDGYVFDGQALFDDEPADEQASANKGGKRLAATGGKSSGRPVAAPKKKKSGPYDSPGAINWVRLITFGISLVIIIAALIIVFTVIYPMLHNPDTPPTEPNTPPGVTDVDPNEPPSEPGDVPPEEPPVEPVVPDAPLNSLTLKSKNDYDFTLKVGESHTPTPVLDPIDWDGTLTWTSSDVTFATVDANGTVTNVNKTTALRRVIITVSGGGQEVEITVYCRGTDADPNAPPVNTDAPTGLAPGVKGRITGAASGLRVRGGPGTTYEILASLVNGNQVTILQDAGNGWYKISYSGGNGEATGYIMGEYIAIN